MDRMFLPDVEQSPQPGPYRDLIRPCITKASTVCASFNFYNRWIDATGVHAMSDEAHRLGGKRMATGTYARE